MQNNSNDRNNERSHEEKHSRGWNEERHMADNNDRDNIPMNDDRPYSRGSVEARSDNDDFNDSGFDDESREATSRTFNEDEDTWEQEQRMQGTRRNNEPSQYSPGIHDDEQRDMSSHGRYNDDEQNRYGRENDRRNREELEE